jgi:hypothetical protein
VEGRSQNIQNIALFMNKAPGHPGRDDPRTSIFTSIEVADVLACKGESREEMFDLAVRTPWL